MQFQGFWLCLSLLLLSLVKAELQDEDVEMEDFDESSEEIMTNEDKLPPEVKYKTPQPIGEVYFTETFDNGILTGWVLSKARKEDTDENIAKYDGRWEIEDLKENRVPGDRGLVLKSQAKHHAISALLSKPFIFADKPLIVQYEVNFQNGMDCGGAYIKLLTDNDYLNLENFFDKTPYTIMFGPDKCGEDHKLHLIFRYKHPKTEVFEEKHAKIPNVDLKKFFSDKKTHLYTLVMNPDNTFEVYVDQVVVNQGSLLEDVDPPINPPKEIEDPDDKKPDDWDDRLEIPDNASVKPEDWDESQPAQIEDPDAFKPEGWLDDEPEYIEDPNAEKPPDWSEDMDGKWEAPRVPNPACKIGCGQWQPPMIDNPKYRGKWEPPMIDNPNYQPGVFTQLLTAAEERWWLWIIYALTAGLPLVLITLFCWPRKKKDEDAEYKKSDIHKPQTKGALEQEVKEEKAALENTTDLKEEKANQDDGEIEKEEDETEEKSEEENEAIDGQEEGSKSNKSGSEDEMKEADESTGSGDGPVKSVRKRKVRKD
ncbi:calmegin isoform X2 [Notamacropus eugenii]|uniref:calmegin isoform X2 n=1 Tax=Notamacropus eugenii TaxID=9315 RepID=UPI003B67D92A